MNFKEALRRRIAEEALMNKAAAAVLTPEAEQAALQGAMPEDPTTAGGAMGAAGAPLAPPAGAQGSGGGQLPPEIMQDQGFIQWLQQQGVMFDPQSGMFMDPQGQPLPVDAVMQAYQAYQQEMQMAQGGGAPAGAPPMDPAAAGGMPPAGAAPQGGGALPPEVLQDEQFAQFMEQAVGAPMDPNQGTFVDPQSGQPLPPDMVMQAYQAYQQQMGGAPEGGAAPEGGNEIPPEVLGQIQSVVDASIQNFSAQLDKKIESLLDKLETVKMALEAMRDTDDKRDKQEREATKELQDEIAAELNPEVKTASETMLSVYPERKLEPVQPPKPLNMFDYIINRNRK